MSRAKASSVRLSVGVPLTGIRNLSWPASIALAALLVALLSELSFDIALWISVGVFHSTLVVRSLAYQMKGAVAIHLLMVFNYVFQHFIVALILLFYPPVAFYDIGLESYARYFSFAVPACIGLHLGVYFATRHLLPAPFMRSTLPAPPWASHCEKLCWVGLLALVIPKVFPIPATALFVFTLLSYLRYVGVFGLILTNGVRWKLYAAIFLSLDIAVSVSFGYFHDLILFCGALFLVISYRFAWDKWKLPILLLGICLVILLQPLKADYRLLLEAKHGDTTVEKLSAFSQLFVNSFNENSLRSPEFLAQTLVRFNQGWLVSRVMQHVPTVEPFARGGTIIDGLYGVFVPRVFYPDKPVAGGREYLERFTDVQLNETTSMSIGVTGEMFANFGLMGGVVAMALYGVLLGFLFKLLYRKAKEHPVWWAWAPFVGFMAMKAEEGLSETLGWGFRAMLVMMFITWILGTRRAHWGKNFVSRPHR